MLTQDIFVKLDFQADWPQMTICFYYHQTFFKVGTIANHSNERVAYSFLGKVLKMFGTLFEIITNQSTKFPREFQKLCENAPIDHCTTL
jgi:hypothetical protein